MPLFNFQNTCAKKTKTPKPELRGSVIKQLILLERVRRRKRAQRAGRVRADHEGRRVSATCRAGGQAVGRVKFDVGCQVGGQRDGCAGRFALFQRELVGRRVNLAEVVNASIGLRGGARFHEVRNRNGRQEADDGHDDHDFNQREARFTGVFDLFHLFCFLFITRRNDASGWLYDYDFVPLIA